MRVEVLAVIGAVVITACSVKPEPINYGQDNCHLCKMTIMDKKFGAEVVTTKGKVFKFDDVNCMVNFLNSGYLEERDVAFRLVTDYSQPGKLIAADEAFFIKSPDIRSPMAGQVASFETDERKNEFKKQWSNSIYLTWGELTTQYK
ncbi:MAG: nitrous oxide reductase accessory protein NosL [Flammeovirgaceae bacterium]|nr:MAG: nitrous oxide reductase accessory protein NosL [Flammeovirgaceae bacterium]